MRLTIYIVDDEQMAIRYLSYLLEQTDLDYEIVGQSVNSKHALSEIISLKPDLVFADINMPIIDGLELTERILQKINTKIFLLTSYRDFDFVKRGLQLGASDYLLKNEMTEASLRELLKKTEQDLIREKQEHHVVLEHNIRKFLTSVSANLEDHVYEHKPMQRYALIGILKPQKLMFRHQPPENSGFSIDCYELENLDYPEGLVCSAFAEMAEGRCYGIFFIQEEITDGQPLLIEAGNRLLSFLSRKQISCTCFISDTCHHFFELQNAYREMQSLEAYLYTCSGHPIFSVRELRKKQREQVNAELWINRIDACVEQQEDIRAWEILQELFRKCRKNLSVWEYMENMKLVCQYLRNSVKKRNLRPEILDIPDQYDTTEALETALSECLGLMFKEARQDTISEHSVHVQRALLYIRRNYSRDISVPDIAEAANVSEGHLRRLFKQELNVKVVDFLMDYRLQCAKLLMEHGENTLTEIWQKTGFTSAQYFSYVFKKKEGMLPREYMKQLRRE